MKEFDYPLDLGIVLHCTNDQIWAEEVARDPALGLVTKACQCRHPLTCTGGDNLRRHVQHLFGGEADDLRTAMQAVADLVGMDRTPDELLAVIKLAVTGEPPPAVRPFSIFLGGRER